MLNSPTRLTLDTHGAPIDIPYRISKRATRIALRVDPLKGPELVVPHRTSLDIAKTFLYQKELWLRHTISHRAYGSPKPFTQGLTINIYGTACTILQSGNTRGTVLHTGNTLIVSGHREHIHRRVKHFLKTQAKTIATAKATFFADQLGQQFRKITIRDTSSRWGSCSHNKNLSFSWRLILAPCDVFDYVVAHEVAHLVKMDHSPAFWSIVAQLMPDYQKHRQWLKKHGHTLYQFAG